MEPKQFSGRGRVAVLRTTPDTVLEDYRRVMQLAGVEEALPKDKDTLLKINISWQQWYPACSTAPWQLEGAIRTLLDAGYKNLIAAHNRTVVVDAYVGERNNKHKLVVDRYGLENVHLYEPEVEWITYEPKTPMLVLDKVYPDGIKIPKMFIGKNIVQFPTVKTHVFTTITGAMKNAFGGLLSERRHWTHTVIHLAGNPAGNPYRHLRRDGWHVCGRWAWSPRHERPREGHHPGFRRPGGDRRHIGQTPGF